VLTKESWEEMQVERDVNGKYKQFTAFPLNYQGKEESKDKSWASKGIIVSRQEMKFSE
jgi:hypothetical protein